MYDDDFRDNSYASAESFNAFMTKVFGWLFLGLLLTAAASLFFIGMLADETSIAYALFGNMGFFIAMIIAELVLVFALSATIHKIGAGLSKLMYAVYAVVNGITLSYIILMYASAVVTQAFLMAGVFFGVMCLYGYFTKSDMTSLSRILSIGLVCLIVPMLINMFIGSRTMDFIVCLAGLAIFVGLTAVDVQKIKTQYFAQAAATGEEMAKKTAIMGALKLYLDFINMFIFILRLLGRRD